MDEEHAQVVDAIRHLIEANDRARVQLDETTALLRSGIDHLEAGGGIVQALHALPIAERRKATQDAIHDVVQARHQLRLRAISTCTRHGIAPAQIAEIWGVSRQRVVQCLAEVRAQDAATSA
jgi:hypothetical protein